MSQALPMNGNGEGEIVGNGLQQKGISSSEAIAIIRKIYVRQLRYGPSEVQPLMFYGHPGAGKTDTIIQVSKILANDYVAHKLKKTTAVADLMSNIYRLDPKKAYETAKKEFEVIKNDIPDEATVRQCKAEMGDWNCVIISAPLLEPTDVKGVPSIDYDAEVQRKVALWIKPYFLKESGAGVIFIDDITAASPSVIASLLHLIQHRRVQEFKLSDDIMIIAAGNRTQDQSYCTDLSAAVRSRVTQFDFLANMEDWLTWAYNNSIEPLIISFLRFNNNSKYFIPKEVEMSADRAFACPRTWKHVSNWMATGLEGNLLREAIIGSIGMAAANEFINFMKLREELPTIQEILENPLNTKIPEKIDSAYAVGGALAAAARDEKNFGAIIAYTLRLKEEYQMLIFSEAIRVNLNLAFSGSKTIGRDGKEKINYGEDMAKFTQKYKKIMEYKRSLK